MARSREESQRVVSIAISGALLLLLSLGYLFVPRADLEDKSPLSVLASPNKEDVFTCEGYSAGELYVPKDDSASEKIKQIQSYPGLEVALEARSSEDGCRKYSGLWTQVKTDDGSVRTSGLGWSDVGNLISKDLPSTGGLFLLLGASPALGFLVFQSVRGTNRSLKTQKVFSSIANRHHPEAGKQSRATSENLEERLAQIKSLHQKGLITSEEFSNKKKELLEEL